MSGTYAYEGIAQPGVDATDHNSQSFLVNRIMNQRHTATLAQVVAITNIVEYGSAEPIKTIDVLPMVHQLTGAGQPVPHTTVYGVPYFRYQGGKNAIIVDPAVGDVGLFLVAENDISTVKATGKPSNPGSQRRGNFADGIYIGCSIAGTPNQYIAFTETGITIHDKNGNVLTTGVGGVTINGALITPGGDVVTARGTDVDTHEHTRVTTGTGLSGPPA